MLTVLNIKSVENLNIFPLKVCVYGIVLSSCLIACLLAATSWFAKPAVVYVYYVLSQAHLTVAPHCWSMLLASLLTAALLTSLPPLLLTANAAPHLIVSPTMYKNCYYHPRLISQFVCALLA